MRQEPKRFDAAKDGGHDTDCEVRLPLGSVARHVGHWLVSLAYFAPAAGFVVWLMIVTLKERWAARGRDGEGGSCRSAR